MSNGEAGLVLASGSPRRRALLDMLAVPFEVVPAAVDERYREGEDPRAHAERLAREKAALVAARRPGTLAIGADTVVVVDGLVLGKPVDEADAVRMLMLLQGRAHEVATGVAVSNGEAIRSGVESVEVRFRSFDDAYARAYVRTGEPMDKAGAYGIQGYGATLVEAIRGDFFAVMGLPIVRLLALLEAEGWRYTFGGAGSPAPGRAGSAPSGRPERAGTR